MGVAPLQGLGDSRVRVTWACARAARSSPGYHMTGFQPLEYVPALTRGFAERRRHAMMTFILDTCFVPLRFLSSLVAALCGCGASRAVFIRVYPWLN
jgi:hypothetical protein